VTRHLDQHLVTHSYSAQQRNTLGDLVSRISQAGQVHTLRNLAAFVVDSVPSHGHGLVRSPAAVQFPNQTAADVIERQLGVAVTRKREAKFGSVLGGFGVEVRKLAFSSSSGAEAGVGFQL
jgi:hypothetical protein